MQRFWSPVASWRGKSPPSWFVAFAAKSKLVAPGAIVTSSALKTCKIKKRFTRMMKHRIGEGCDDFWTAATCRRFQSAGVSGRSKTFRNDKRSLVGDDDR